MIENDKLSELLEKAKNEENSYNWADAAKVYEQVAKIFLDKKKMEDAASAYKTLGRIYFLISETTNTSNKFVESLNRTIEAYNKAANLFEENENKAEQLECKAESSFASGFIASSRNDAKTSYNNSIELFVEASKLFSENDDQESLARILSRAAFCFTLTQPFLDNKIEGEHFFHKGSNLAS